jgi:hypothetical protein
MELSFLGNLDASVGPLAWGGLGAVAAIGFWLAARWQRDMAIVLRFMAAMAVAWLALCLTYALAQPDSTFTTYLASSTLATQVIAGMGLVAYIGSLFRHRPRYRPWRRSSSLVAGLTLMGSAFVRAAYQPSVTLIVEAPIAAVFVVTAWRLRAELLVYLSLLALVLAGVLASRQPWAEAAGKDAAFWITSTASGIALVMALAAAVLSLVRRPEANVRWYRQGLLIVPVAAATVATLAAGCLAAWYGTSWHTVWALGVWWLVLLVSSIGLKLPDLFGFSSIGAALAAAAAFAMLGGESIGGYWGRYAALLVVVAMGVALLSAVLKPMLRRPPWAGFPQALYLVGAAMAVAALLTESLATTPQYLGVDLLIAAGVLALAHIHRAPAWVNYLVASLVTAGVAPLVHLRFDAPWDQWHHRFILVTAMAAVVWLGVALVVRETLRRTASDRAARRHSLPFTILGMGTTGVLAAYLALYMWMAYAAFLAGGPAAEDGRKILLLLGPDWGLAGWLAVLLAWALSMWLVRHTARTFLFYLFGISVVIYIGLFNNTHDLYGYLICAVAGYGAAHLVVYLYEARFMALLSRTCALYHDENRASTTIFTLAMASCLTAAGLAAFRLNTPEALVMLSIMAAVFLAWAFIWVRSEMLYPAVLMTTLATLAVWHNLGHPAIWDAGRLAINSVILTASALAWLAIGKGLHPIRSHIFQLAAPARVCSVILAVLGMGFAAAMAISPTFRAEVWKQPRSPWDWTLGMVALVTLLAYFGWARFVFGRRFFGLMGGVGALLMGLYVGIYVGFNL